MSNSHIVIYQDKETGITIDVKLDGKTIWLDQYQLEALFETDRTSISRHLRNIYQSNELDKASTCAKIAQVQKEGARGREWSKAERITIYEPQVAIVVKRNFAITKNNSKNNSK